MNVNILNTNTIKNITKTNINLNKIINDYETILHKVVQNNNINGVRLLLKAGAKPNIKDINGNTSLHLAACRGSLNIVKLLLKYGANPNLKDNSGETPMHTIFECEQQGRTKRSYNVIELLLKSGGKPNIKTNSGYTVLQTSYLVSARNDIKQLLLNYGATPINVNKRWNVNNYMFTDPVTLNYPTSYPYVIVNKNNKIKQPQLYNKNTLRQLLGTTQLNPLNRSRIVKIQRASDEVYKAMLNKKRNN